MKDLQIKRTDGVAEFEDYLGNSATFLKNLVIPNDLEDGGGIGTSVAFCQFLLTWARKKRSPEIKTYLIDGDKVSYTRFTDRVHGLFAAYVSERLVGKTTAGNSVNLRYQVLKSAKPRILAMSKGILEETAKGREIEFIFVQGADNHFHGSLYTKVPTTIELLDRQKHGELIRSHRELGRMLERCFVHLNIGRLLDKQFPKREAVFGVLLSELFRNSAEHGYYGIHGEKLKLNMRCIRIAATLIERDKLASKSASSPKARESAESYFTNLSQLRGERYQEKVRVLELSVFDSGPGFVATMSGENTTDDGVARLAVAQCFGKHQSAKTAPHGGLGLFKIMAVLRDLGGFIRVRTSTVEVFYGSMPGSDSDITPEDFVFGGLAAVEGSVVTIGIPITY